MRWWDEMDRGTVSLRSRTLEDFLNAPKPPIYYHIRPLLPIGGMLVLAGDVKTFKSYLALNIGYDLARGKEILGVFKVPKPLKVLYVEMEVGEYELDERCTTIHSFHHDDLSGVGFNLITKDMDIQLDTEKGLEILVQELAGVRPDILILDPIVEFHSQDENNAIAMKSMLRPLRRVLQKLHCSLIIVHHSTKPGEWRPGNTASSVRGSYLAGAANTVINITKPYPEKHDEMIQLHFTMRAAKKRPPMTLTFDEKSGGLIERHKEEKVQDVPETIGASPEISVDDLAACIRDQPKAVRPGRILLA